jgi:hypothetical protein
MTFLATLLQNRKNILIERRSEGTPNEQRDEQNTHYYLAYCCHSRTVPGARSDPWNSNIHPGYSGDKRLTSSSLTFAVHG